MKSAAENEQGEPARQGPQDRPLGHPGETGPDGGGRAREPTHRGRHFPPQDLDEKDPGRGDLPEGNHVWHAQCSGEAQGCRNKSPRDNCSNDKGSYYTYITTNTLVLILVFNTFL
jgi:hypothetical protein